MSTTNPEHGRPPADPVGGLAPIPPGTPRADDHDISGPPAADTIARGHEVDTYDTASVFSVPLLVVLFFVLAFGTVSVIFYFIFPNPADPNAHPMAVEDSKKDIPDRHAQVTDPPLDNFRHLEGNTRSITSPERSAGNSPWIHPEDLRVNSTNTPALYRSGWLDPAKTRARLTIDEAMDIAAKKDSKVLKSRATPAALSSSQNVPTAANAGRGEGASKADPPKDPTAAVPQKKGGPPKGEGKKGKK
jgi:hypothetical protein